MGRLGERGNNKDFKIILKHFESDLLLYMAGCKGNTQNKAPNPRNVAKCLRIWQFRMHAYIA